jgi:hypothetical protein
LQKEKWGECAVNITFAAHETDLYDHFRSLCKDVFQYDVGSPQAPGNGTVAIRGFIYSRFVAEWLIENGVLPGEKSARELHLPRWVMESRDPGTWVAALQPWCDGEGHVSTRATGGSAGFTMLQARHTNLDFESISRTAICGDNRRSISAGHLRDCNIYGVPVLQYCGALHRSEILADVTSLFDRLGFRPKTRIACLFLKNDGFWSCHWILRFSECEMRRMRQMGLITQARKREDIM